MKALISTKIFAEAALLQITPNKEMAMPFLYLKPLTRFGFQFTKVWLHFCELVLLFFVARIVILKTNNVIFAQVFTILHLDQD